MKYTWVHLTPDNWRWVATDLEQRNEQWRTLYRYALAASKRTMSGVTAVLLREDERDRVYEAKRRRYESRRAVELTGGGGA